MTRTSFYNNSNLLALLAAGNSGAIRELFDAMFQRLAFYAHSIIANRDEAEDIAQQAFVILWEQRANWETKQLPQLESYLFTVVRNQCLNYLKHQQVIKNNEQALAGINDDYLPELRQMEEHVLNHIYEEINALPPKYANVLQLIFIRGLDVPAIAAQLGITPNNVRNQKARALEMLRTRLLRKHLYAEAGLLFFLEFL